ncbi:TetR/AcrR family transcriptional regulator [Streptomyces sp. NPDC020707]|jgi:AcrR family transcriptional regulator|uniref:TetR/AcrR family transcriptional regulator n=1 Tax=Streptomyces ortus TaxID=2867268 RepID=A0ABT3VGP3_9ACTN|nr:MULTISPECIES: TetR/AcrR family transcriptional regulator [Streptomyces]MCX4237493.1 TetR/AcrR family transcriptional regulator [Streptomyces ortus]
MSPRPAPDLDLRRDRIIRAARELAESEGWEAVTMRRVTSALGVSQPVLYSAFTNRQALIDAVALSGFTEIAEVLEAADSDPMARMRAYLDFASARPHLYEAMFSMPTDLGFGTEDAPEALRRAFAAIHQVFPSPDHVRAEVAWATLHGLATLQTSGRQPASRVRSRLEHAHRILTE